MIPEIAAALADVKNAMAEMDAALGPWRPLIPQNVATDIDSIQARLADAVSKLEAALQAP